MQLLSKFSNLCDPDPRPPTSQTNRQTDYMRSQDRAFHYSIVHRAVIISTLCISMELFRYWA